MSWVPSVTVLRTWTSRRSGAGHGVRPVRSAGMGLYAGRGPYAALPFGLRGPSASTNGTDAEPRPDVLLRPKESHSEGTRGLLQQLPDLVVRQAPHAEANDPSLVPRQT